MYPAEIQTMIDECADGTWEGTVLVGSTFDSRYQGESFVAVSDLLRKRVGQLQAMRQVA
jgi:hypothetical protein